VESLSFSSKFASYYAMTPPGVKREFSCTVGTTKIAPYQPPGGVLVR
jgi:hypothetical protein